MLINAHTMFLLFTAEFQTRSVSILYLCWILHNTPKTGTKCVGKCEHDKYLVLPELFQWRLWRFRGLEFGWFNVVHCPSLNVSFFLYDPEEVTVSWSFFFFFETLSYCEMLYNGYSYHSVDYLCDSKLLYLLHGSIEMC